MRFDGSSCVTAGQLCTIYGSNNVASVVRNATPYSLYRINFIQPMLNSFYGISLSAGVKIPGNGQYPIVWIDDYYNPAPDTTGFNIGAIYSNGGSPSYSGWGNFQIVNAQVFL